MDLGEADKRAGPARMSAADAPAPRSAPAMFVVRGMVFFGLWLALIGTAPKHWPLGVLAAAAASWSTLMLWPGQGRLSAPGLIRFSLRFLPQAVVAGLDVASRAFAPKLSLNPGLVCYPTALPPGFSRGGLCAVMSLQPGKLPVNSAEATTLLVHCLDVETAVLAEMVADETAFLQLWTGGKARG